MGKRKGVIGQGLCTEAGSGREGMHIRRMTAACLSRGMQGMWASWEPRELSMARGGIGATGWSCLPSPQDACRWLYMVGCGFWSSIRKGENQGRLWTILDSQY